MCREIGQRANGRNTGETWAPGSVSIFPLVHGIGETERDVSGSWDRNILVSGLKGMAHMIAMMTPIVVIDTRE